MKSTSALAARIQAVLPVSTLPASAAMAAQGASETREAATRLRIARRHDDMEAGTF